MTPWQGQQGHLTSNSPPFRTHNHPHPLIPPHTPAPLHPVTALPPRSPSPTLAQVKPSGSHYGSCFSYQGSLPQHWTL